MPINPVQLTLYLLYEHQFYLDTHSDRKLEDVEKDEGYEQFLISVVLDKYFTNEHLSYRSGSFATRFIPEISTINLYLNFILGMLSRYKQGDPKETLVVDILQKGFSMAKCIVDLLTNGFETEAFSTWRTLHENECILQVIVKYGQPVIDQYLKHLKFALAFRGALPTKEETDKTFEEIKAGMVAIALIVFVFLVPLFFFHNAETNYPYGAYPLGWLLGSVAEILAYYSLMYMVDYLNTSHKDLMDALRTNKAFDDALTKGFIDAIKDYKSSRQ